MFLGGSSKANSFPCLRDKAPLKRHIEFLKGNKAYWWVDEKEERNLWHIILEENLNL